MPRHTEAKSAQPLLQGKQAYAKPKLRQLGDLRTLTQGGNSGRREGPFGIVRRRVMN